MKIMPRNGWFVLVPLAVVGFILFILYQLPQNKANASLMMIILHYVGVTQIEHQLWYEHYQRQGDSASTFIKHGYKHLVRTPSQR